MLGLMKGKNIHQTYLSFKNGIAEGSFVIDYENNGHQVVGSISNNFKFKALKSYDPKKILLMITPLTVIIDC